MSHKSAPFTAVATIGIDLGKDVRPGHNLSVLIYVKNVPA